MRQRASFANVHGETLSGWLIRPAGEIRAAAIFAHCFTCTAQSKAAVVIAEELAAEGVAVLRFDFTGLGSSEGDFGREGFGGDVSDIEAATQYLEEEGLPPSLLVGHSLGGAAVLAVAARIPSVTAVATIGAPSDVAHSLHRVEGDLDAISANGTGKVSIGGRPFSVTSRFLEQTRSADLLARVHAMRKPLLVCHAPRDEVVGIENARAVFDAAMHPKSFVSLDGADHLLLERDDAVYAARIIAAWASRHLPPPREDHPPEGETICVNDGPSFVTTGMAGTNSWIADEPEAVGGTGLGPAPYDMLLGALGACTAMTLRIVAKREDIPLDEVRVRLTHERNHRHDGEANSEGGHASIQAINREVSISGPMSEAQHARLIDVADRCPVHRTLTGTLHVHDTVSD
jgi:uncharacterized OsmC-like protein/fermentation-respiration switch protein FrsA (DUF1100 family)